MSIVMSNEAFGWAANRIDVNYFRNTLVVTQRCRAELDDDAVFYCGTRRLDASQTSALEFVFV